MSLELFELRRDALLITIVPLVCTSPLAYLATPLPTFGRCMQHATSNSPKSLDQLTLVNQAEQSTPVALQFSDAVSVQLSASDELRES